MKKNAIWIGAAFIVTILFGTIYATTQQSLRLTANELPTQLAEETARELDVPNKPTDVLPARVDVVKSLAPFVIIYDASGAVVAGSGYLSGTVPKIPFGVLQHGSTEHHNAITWEPQPGVRLATVSTKSSSYYVLAGRSLREVEKVENKVYTLSIVGWFISILTLGALYMFINFRQLLTIKKKSSLSTD